MLVVTLVGTPSLSADDVALASKSCSRCSEPVWLSDMRAAEFSAQSAEAVALEAVLPHVDVFVQLEATREKSLFVADMDSTMIQVECIDELADYAGLKVEIAAVTEAAMRGELDFEAALRKRVALLAGLDVGAIAACLRDRVRPTPGAATLIATLKAEGIRTVLVSGGFTAFANPVGTALGFDLMAANVLAESEGKLTGDLVGPVVDAAAKRDLLLKEAAGLGISTSQAVAIGDGANDLDMVMEAGLGIAFHAKSALARAADVRIRNGDLSTLLHALGIGEDRWVRR